MEILLSLLLAVVLITLVGHGIWVLAQFLLKKFFPSTFELSEKKPASFELCRHCNERLRLRAGNCSRCGYSPEQALKFASLQTTLEQLEAFYSNELISLSDFENLKVVITEQLEAVAGKRKLAGVGAVPAAIEPVEESILEALPVSEPLPSPAAGNDLVPASSDLQSIPSYVYPEPSGEPKPAPPRRSLAEVLSAFMEQRNILWGELLGGFLMVGCSIALVVSLWTTIEQLRYSPFLILAALTAGIFGAGHYTLSHWKLASTSRGLLLVATILVPLNLLLLARLSLGMEGGWIEIAIKVAAVAVFSWLVHRAGRVLLPEGGESPPRRLGDSWLLPISVVFVGASQFPIHRLLVPAVPGPAFLGLAGAALGFFAVSLAAVLGQRRRDPHASDTSALSLLTFLGLSSFSLAVSWAFLLFWVGSTGASGVLGECLKQLSPLVAGAGLSIVAVGLWVRRQFQDALPGTPQSRFLFVGTLVSQFGALGLLAAVALAWPSPTYLVSVCGVNFLMLTALALYWAVPIAHAPALACLTVGFLTAFHWIRGALTVDDPADLGRTLFTALQEYTGGIALVGLFAILVAAAEVLTRLRRNADRVYYRIGSSGVGILSMVLVGGHGFIETLFPAILFPFYAASFLILASRWTSKILEHLGAALVLLATVWTMKFWHPTEYGLWGAALAFDVLLFCVLEGGWGIESLCGLGLAGVTTLVALRLGPITVWPAITAISLAGAGFAQAQRRQARPFTWAGSALLLAGIGYAVIVRFADFVTAPYLVTLLLFGVVTLAAAFAIRRYRPQAIALFSEPLGKSAFVALLLAIVCLISVLNPTELGARSLYGIGLAGLWLGYAVIEKKPRTLVFCQLTVSLASILGVGHLLRAQSWFADSYPASLIDPRSLQQFGLALVGVTAIWAIVRLSLRGRAVATDWLEAISPGFDRIQGASLVAFQLALALLAIAPPILQEAMAPSILGFELTPWTEWTSKFSQLSSWGLLGATAVMLLLWLWEARKPMQQTVWIGCLTCLPLLACLHYSLPFAGEIAAAHALKWSLAACFTGLGVVLALRGYLEKAGLKFGFQGPHPATPMAMSGFILVGAALPVLILSLCQLSGVMTGLAGVGPSASSVFGLITPSSSFVGPLALLLFGMALMGLKERLPEYGLSGACLALLTATGGYALGIVTAGRSFSPSEEIHLLQLGTLAVGLWSLGWLSLWVRFGLRDSEGELLGAKTKAGLKLIAWSLSGLLGILVVAPLARLSLYPSIGDSSLLHQSGGVLGWLTFAIAAAVIVFYWHVAKAELRGHAIGAIATALGVYLACLAARWDHGQWLGFHTFAITWMAGAWFLLLFKAAIEAKWPAIRIESRPWVAILGLLSACLALSGEVVDPWRPWGPSALVLAAGALAVGQGFQTKRQAEAIASAVLVTLAGLIVWYELADRTVETLSTTVALGLSIVSLFWSILPYSLRRLQPAGGASQALDLAFAQGVRRGSAIVGLGIMSLLAAAMLILGYYDFHAFPRTPLPWISLGCSLIALSALWDDKRAMLTPSTLYVWGLTTLAMAMGASGLPSVSYVCWGMLIYSAYALATSLMARSIQFSKAAVAEGANKATGLAINNWFIGAQWALTSLIALASFWVVLTFVPSINRLSAPLSLVLLTTGWVLIANCHESIKALRPIALVMAILAVLETFWVIQSPETLDPGQHRLVTLVMALALGTVAYLTALPRMLKASSAWSLSSRMTAPILGWAAFGVMIPLIGLEALHFAATPGVHALDIWEIAGGCLALLALAATGIYVALHSQANLFPRPATKESVFVYGAELFLAGAFLHLRFSAPELFSEWITRYWTFVVMAIAFLGVGLGEFFQRKQIAALADPIKRTGMFLPILPLMAFWIKTPSVEPFGSYSLLWFLFGTLYAWLAVTHRSFGFGLVAALAGNFALWMLWQHEGISPFVHPQAWLIPLAVIVLASESVTRGRLNAEGSAAIRYVGLGMLYASSTADMFIRGLGHSVMLPLILALLSSGGVLAGMAFRIRSYLFMGSAFLVLVVFSMIWHAAVDQKQPWIWWICGIVMGAGILALFGIFERRRQQIAHVLDEFRNWR